MAALGVQQLAAAGDGYARVVQLPAAECQTAVSGDAGATARTVRCAVRAGSTVQGGVRENAACRSRAGPNILFRDRMVGASVMSVAGAILLPTIITVAQVFFVREELGAPAAVCGFMVTGMALGRLVTSTFIEPRVPSARQPQALSIGGMLKGYSLPIVSIRQRIAVTFAALFPVGVGNSLQSLAIRAIVHEHAPESRRGSRSQQCSRQATAKRSQGPAPQLRRLHCVAAYAFGRGPGARRSADARG